MSIIKRRPKETLKPISFRLPESLIRKFSAFADFTNVPQSEIIVAALNHVIDADKEFAAFSHAGNSLKNEESERAVITGSNTERSRPAIKKIAESNTESPNPDNRLKAVPA